jgi:iron complex outermembrane receptor protein
MTPGVFYRISGVVRDSGTTIDHVDDKRYNIAPSLTWNIDPDTKLTFLSQFNRDDTGITSQFLPITGHQAFHACREGEVS